MESTVPRVTVCYSIDSPAQGELAAGRIECTGWCFAVNGQPVELRIRSADFTVYPTRGVERRDVANAYPWQSDALNSGFCGRILHHGLHG